MGEINYRKRGKKWEYRFEAAPVDGKRKQISKGGFTTKAECIIAAEEAKRRYNSPGKITAPKEISISDYLDYWFDHYCVMNTAYNTQLSYIGIIKNHLKPQFGIYKLNALSTAAVQEYIYDLKKAGLSKNTIVGIISVLSGAYEYAIEPLHYLDANPCDRVKYPKFESKSDKGHYYITPETFKNIIELFPDKDYFRIPIIIGYRCGLRIGEVFGLTWDDIDFKNNTISIKRQIIKRNYGVEVRQVVEKKKKKEEKSRWYLATLKTPMAVRTISVDIDTMNILKKYHRKQLENRLEYGEYYTEQYLQDEKDEKGNTIQRIIPVQRCIPCMLPQADVVFRRENGEYISTDSFKYASRVIHSKISEPFDFHSLRHTHATMLAEAGANPEAVRKRMGHTDIKITLKYYTHVTEKLEADMMEKIEKFVHA